MGRRGRRLRRRARSWLARSACPPAWADLSLPLLPPAPASILDVGCGTGSLSVLLAQAGHDVHGVDFSERMIAVARAKAETAGVAVRFEVGDAQAPPAEPASFSVVLGRTSRGAARSSGSSPLLGRAPGNPGTVLLVEGRWSSGAGPRRRSATSRSAFPPGNPIARLEDPALWRGPISDERYLLVSRR